MKYPSSYSQSASTPHPPQQTKRKQKKHNMIPSSYCSEKNVNSFHIYCSNYSVPFLMYLTRRASVKHNNFCFKIYFCSAAITSFCTCVVMFCSSICSRQGPKAAFIASNISSIDDDEYLSVSLSSESDNFT